MGFIADILHGIGFISVDIHDAEVQRLSERLVKRGEEVIGYRQRLSVLCSSDQSLRDNLAELRHNLAMCKMANENKDALLEELRREVEQQTQIDAEFVLLQDRIAHYEAVITEMREVLSPAIPPMTTTSGFVQPN